MRTCFSMAALAAAAVVATAGTAVAQCEGGWDQTYTQPSWSGYSQSGWQENQGYASYGDHSGWQGQQAWSQQAPRSARQSARMHGSWTPQASYHYSGGQQADWDSSMSQRGSARTHGDMNTVYDNSSRYANQGSNRAVNYGQNAYGSAQSSWNQAGDYSNHANTSWNTSGNAQFGGSTSGRDGGYSGSNAGGFGLGW